jgi:hypothetical protein
MADSNQPDLEPLNLEAAVNRVERERYVDLLWSISTTVADYRRGEIPPIHASHVAKWVKQFESQDRLVILEELDRMLKQRYVSRSQMRDAITTLLQRVLRLVPKAEHSRIRLMNASRKGNSQNELLNLAREILATSFQIDTEKPIHSPAIYIYLDDCLFTGNTLIYDAKNWLNQNSSIQIERIYFLFHTTHSSGEYYVGKQFEIPLKSKNISWRILSLKQVQNNPNTTGRYDCFWSQPCSEKEDVLGLVDQLQQQPYSRIWRPLTVSPTSELFSSSENRDMIEKAFLNAGFRITTFSTEQKPEMRPLGYEKLTSLGFGAMFVTYRNIANNCPLVLWWGDPNKPSHHPLGKWYPLFPRMSNLPVGSDT